MTDDFLQKLRHIFPDTLIIAALDLVDRERVIKLQSSWGRTFFEVLGSTGSYTVHPLLPSATPVYCNCPSFTVSVLLSEDLLMCKHVLAVHVAQRLERCSERKIALEDLPSVVARQSNIFLAA
ncbi:hypothetical protein BD410DRAFT_767446 [Rickenella mellea]|uniref:SWIM-type domain-containing protein n=1 Tax=Rickenella mellea TaxID=50990 RepID=A0A4Y7QA66_9AGAM|nr:hypothetical protein BD410DRAFT_767446 [Rickenella mellea]